MLKIFNILLHFTTTRKGYFDICYFYFFIVVVLLLRRCEVKQKPVGQRVSCVTSQYRKYLATAHKLSNSNEDTSDLANEKCLRAIQKPVNVDFSRLCEKANVTDMERAVTIVLLSVVFLVSQVS